MNRLTRQRGARLRRACLLTALAGVLAAGGMRGLAADSPTSLPQRPPLVTEASEAAVQRALTYLVANQYRDGSWRSGRRGLGSAYPCSMTSLAGIALMSAGNTPHEGPYAENVQRAVTYVLSCAAPNGLIARPEEEGQVNYGHGFSLLFLSQALGMEQDPVRQERLIAVLKKGIEFSGRIQKSTGGWHYTPEMQGDEGSVTVTQIHGLRACRDAGIDAPKSIIDKACAYINMCATKSGGIGYNARTAGSGRPLTAITAAAVSTMYYAGQYDHPVAVRALNYLINTLDYKKKNWGAQGHFYYTLMYASQAMYLSSDKNWNDFFPHCRDLLVKQQADDGSWQGDGIGQVYGTAIGVMSLQLPYAYLPVFQR